MCAQDTEPIARDKLKEPRSLMKLQRGRPGDHLSDLQSEERMYDPDYGYAGWPWDAEIMPQPAIDLLFATGDRYDPLRRV